MKSGYKIDWSDEALNNLDSTIDYLTTNWTDKEVRNFYKKLDGKLNIISKNPLAFPATYLKTNVRRCVMSEQTTIYYEIKTECIILLSLFDNRKDPKSIKI
jgi:plasmid stabilization system protein ParE